ncbi:hypothetical protein BGX29_003703, partial [Mortierella sp. GBA35]
MIKVCIASKIGIAGLQKDPRMVELRKSSLEAQKRKPPGPKLTTAHLKAWSSTTTTPLFKAPVRNVVFEW